MVNARHFGNGKTLLWTLQDQWRTDIVRYGDLCGALAKTDPGIAAWHELTLECAKTVVALYDRAAGLELRVQELEQGSSEKEK